MTCFYWKFLTKYLIIAYQVFINVLQCQTGPSLDKVENYSLQCIIHNSIKLIKPVLIALGTSAKECSKPQFHCIIDIFLQVSFLAFWLKANEFIDLFLYRMLIPKKNRTSIYEYLFKEGVMVAKKDFNAPRHPDLETVPNLQVIKAMQVNVEKNVKAKLQIVLLFYC